MKEALDGHLDKLLAFLLVIAFALALIYIARINPQDAGLVEALKGALQYALGIFSALMLPGGLNLLKALKSAPAESPQKQILSQ